MADLLAVANSKPIASEPANDDYVLIHGSSTRRLPAKGFGGGATVHIDASAGDTAFNVVAANDPTARSVIVGKTDATENLVVFTPAGGTVMSEAVYGIGSQNEYKLFVPRQSDNTWIVVQF